jgi:arabinose-5-phosphate isomerase
MCILKEKSNLYTDKQSAEKTINSEIETLNALKYSLNPEALTKALDFMQNASGKSGRIIITGMGKSGHIGRKIAASLASTGTPSFFVHPAEASHGDLGMITENDVVIAISNSGESKELIDILNYCKRFGITLIAITKNADSSLGKVANVLLKLPDSEEACPLGLAPTSSTTATLVLGDILTVALIERNGFSKEDFNERHPGGKLGSILKKVSDLMHTGSEMPILEEHSNMQAVLLEMTSKMLGCVGFINQAGELTGILTDGDLRRCLSADILNHKAIDIMTKNPKTIPPDVMTAEALKLMHDKKITNLFVIENKKPIGVIHIHDLLNNGVA